MKIFKKVIFVILALLPLLYIFCYCINMFSDVAVFNEDVFKELFQGTVLKLQGFAPNVLSDATNDLIEFLGDYIPMNEFIQFAIFYLIYICSVEVMMFIINFVFFIPKKVNEMFERL